MNLAPCALRRRSAGRMLGALSQQCPIWAPPPTKCVQMHNPAPEPRGDAREFETFPHPPIVEAIIAFEVSYLDDLTLSAGGFHDAITGAYPIREELSAKDAASIFPRGRPRLVAMHSVRPDRPPAVGLVREAGEGYGVDTRGLSFRSEDGLQVVRVTRRGLSFHRLKPYISWEHFELETRHVWREFVRFFGPERVVRLRARYLNRIEVPLGFLDFGEFLHTLPYIPAPIDTGMSGYLMRLVLEDLTVPAIAHVTQTVEADASLPYMPLLFDIDVRREADLAPESEALWAAVHAMREYKDRIFFESITERTKELFR